MDKDLDREQSILDKLIVFLKQKKKLVILITFLILVFTITLFVVYEKNKRKNILISEKYVKASILLSKKENKKAKTIYEEIILSNNKFYSLLALNTIIEKKLIISIFNDVISEEATRLSIPIIDLRSLLIENSDFSTLSPLRNILVDSL
mgnify:CR=1 FL=1